MPTTSGPSSKRKRDAEPESDREDIILPSGHTNNGSLPDDMRAVTALHRMQSSLLYSASQGLSGAAKTGTILCAFSHRTYTYRSQF